MNSSALPGIAEPEKCAGGAEIVSNLAASDLPVYSSGDAASSIFIWNGL
jgi:hypothetical protein